MFHAMKTDVHRLTQHGPNLGNVIGIAMINGLPDNEGR
jgi:hypothetical protein